MRTAGSSTRLQVSHPDDLQHARVGKHERTVAPRVSDGTFCRRGECRSPRPSRGPWSPGVRGQSTPHSAAADLSPAPPERSACRGGPMRPPPAAPPGRARTRPDHPSPTSLDCPSCPARCACPAPSALRPLSCLLLSPRFATNVRPPTGKACKQRADLSLGGTSQVRPAQPAGPGAAKRPLVSVSSGTMLSWSAGMPAWELVVYWYEASSPT